MCPDDELEQQNWSCDAICKVKLEPNEVSDVIAFVSIHQMSHFEFNSYCIYY